MNEIQAIGVTNLLTNISELFLLEIRYRGNICQQFYNKFYSTLFETAKYYNTWLLCVCNKKHYKKNKECCCNTGYKSIRLVIKLSIQKLYEQQVIRNQNIFLNLLNFIFNYKTNTQRELILYKDHLQRHCSFTLSNSGGRLH